ncbi:unnamed protein product [Danaus chrysippus]|uniref:Protein CNPPD1 n=1 Tax=Danaus chrysippus TaxID=151541 RepID=A0A8J2RKP1_9NEOP|nr:unnamed protein product [Danaus chrysippus]
MSNISKRKKDGSRAKIKTIGDHKEFLKRITKTLYYGELPRLPCLSLPVTEISCSLWSVSQRGRSLRRLHVDAAADIARSACVSPCALVLAILYLERLKRCNPDYLSAAAPVDLFLVSLMVSNKFLQDDGEDDEVICSEWAASGGLHLDQLKKLEVDFLNAIDWRIFVSEESFEAGLSWLEREVALKQARARGFFTYGDLAAACAGAAAGGAARALAAACAACLAPLLALLASALLLTHSLPAPPAPAASPTDLSVHTDLSPPVAASVVDLVLNKSLSEDHVPNLSPSACCDSWTHYLERSAPSRQWDDHIVVNDWKSSETWWSRTAVTTWLYQISLVDPMQRWLEKTYRSAGLLGRAASPLEAGAGGRSCAWPYLQQWLNFSKLSVYVASVSDR